jgi:hypothetical protein
MPLNLHVEKMERYGINNKTINWVRNFLTDRKQKVSVNGAKSISHDVTSGHYLALVWEKLK